MTHSKGNETRKERDAERAAIIHALIEARDACRTARAAFSTIDSYEFGSKEREAIWLIEYAAGLLECEAAPWLSKVARIEGRRAMN